jgi:hypothetical protein
MKNENEKNIKTKMKINYSIMILLFITKKKYICYQKVDNSNN